MELSKRLSICIPTYNRSQYLEECLISVLETIGTHSDETEIIVGDNGATDDTPQLIARIQQSHPEVRYQRRSENLGAECNIYTLVTEANGEFVWLLGDDDRLTTDAVASVFAAIDAGAEIAICNFSIWSRDFASVKQPTRFPMRQDIQYRDHNAVLARFGIQVGFLSIICMKRSQFLLCPFEKFMQYAEYGLSFMYNVYHAISSECRLTYLSEPLVQYRADNSLMTPSTWNKIFITGSSIVLEDLKTLGYTTTAVSEARHRLLTDYVFTNLLWRTREGVGNRSMFRELLPLYRTDWFFWIACVPTLIVPAFVVRLATAFTRGWRKLRRSQKLSVENTSNSLRSNDQ